MTWRQPSTRHSTPSQRRDTAVRTVGHECGMGRNTLQKLLQTPTTGLYKLFTESTWGRGTSGDQNTRPTQHQDYHGPTIAFSGTGGMMIPGCVRTNCSCSQSKSLYLRNTKNDAPPNSRMDVCSTQRPNSHNMHNDARQ
jgi:hypothetical protein